jgi:3-hydroxybutyryl-CoA dehydrogenase
MRQRKFAACRGHFNLKSALRIRFIMPPDIQNPGLTLGVIGSGVMGRGIAQIAAQAGVRVLLHDSREAAAREAIEAIDGALARIAEKGRISDAQRREALSRIEAQPALEALAPCDVLIEAVSENLEVKRELFRRLEGIVREDCLIASNTSSLQITSIAAACRLPGRVGGFHFFNPVPLMKVVEVIAGALTEPWVGDALCALARRMGHAPVRAKDSPGFIVNHAGRGYGTEALRLHSEGVADFHVIDRVLREQAGFRMGPFELLDLTGLDVSHPVMESIYNQFYQEPRFRPHPLTAQRMAAGLLGRKSGRGFYRYEAGKQETPPLPARPNPNVRPTRVWVAPDDPPDSDEGLSVGHDEVAALVQKLGARLDEGDKPAADSLCVVTPLGNDASNVAADLELDARRTVAVDTLFGLAGHRVIMTTILTAPSMRDAALGLFGADGVPVSAMRDSAGFIAQRTVAHIVNIACDIAQQRIASPSDIDLAAKLSLGYPQGPLSWGDSLGPLRVLKVLEGLESYYGDPRYRPSPWLQRRARLGVSLLAEDT